MCNINYMLKRDFSPSVEVIDWQRSVSWESFKSNDDAEGYVYFTGKRNRLDIAKSEDKLDYPSPKTKPHSILSHQRFSTSGKDLNNCHPFETKDFVLVHNGVIDGLGNTTKSDTSFFVDILQDCYDDLLEGESMIEAISRATEQIRGRYSIFVYDLNTKKLYYFKEDSSNMYYTLTDDYLIMSTAEDNVEYGEYLLKEKYTSCKAVQGFKIFDVYDSFKEVGTFKEKPYEYLPFDSGKIKNVFSPWGDEDSWIDEQVEEYERDKDLIKEDKRRFKIPQEFAWFYDPSQAELLIPEIIYGKQYFVKGDWRNKTELMAKAFSEQRII